MSDVQQQRIRMDQALQEANEIAERNKAELSKRLGKVTDRYACMFI